MTELHATRTRLLLTVAMGAFLAGCELPGEIEGDIPTQEESAAEANTAKASSLLRMADLAMEGGDAATASGLYARAAELEPENPAVQVKLGQSLKARGAMEHAATSFTRALVVDPANTEAMYGLGTALISLDQPAAAIPHLQDAAAAAPGPQVFNALGVALDMVDEHGAAQGAYAQGLALAGDNLTLMNNLGLSYAFAGNYEKAISLLQRAAAHPSATAKHRQNLALAYGLAGEPGKAAEIGGLDLSAESVEGNGSYYEWLRRQRSEAGNATPVPSHQ